MATFLRQKTPLIGWDDYDTEIKQCDLGSMLICKRFPFINENNYFQCNYEAHIEIYKNGNLNHCKHFESIIFDSLIEMNQYIYTHLKK